MTAGGSVSGWKQQTTTKNHKEYKEAECFSGLRLNTKWVQVVNGVNLFL